MSSRHDGRSPDEPRAVTIDRGFARQSDGSALYRCGGTTVLVTANVVDRVPAWLEGKGVGWLTAEYMMMPGSTSPRKERRADSRSTEIQRLIGRSLRAAVDTKALGARTLHVDAEVVDADGGTRTAAITGAFVAVADALRARLGPEAARAVLRDGVAAVSVGVVAGRELLDLDYVEDSAAEVDLNVVRLGSGGLVEVQGTGEGGTFSRAQLTALMDLAERGLDLLGEAQRRALGGDWPFG
ncbi:ribonuclease PH [Tautonia plasticadhaerens]|uniref:Ribonuclease PH n=1 Tax=Tautonia plasticadhaerens TaxID=2527974 RepID=A0A518GZ84_9BACT|nr:ribonuclease PH [Tautonia plasticadhaerens]QDV33908.1 Ribonuclease PH [Tautonia plasticadhaerens]